MRHAYAGRERCRSDVPRRLVKAAVKLDCVAEARAVCSLFPAKMWMSGARSLSSWVAYEPMHNLHRAGVEDLHVRRSPRRPRDTTWSSSSSTAFARKWVRVGRVAHRMTRVVALSRYLAGETARKPRHARRRERRAARANVNASVEVAFSVSLVGEFALDLGSPIAKAHYL